MLIINPTGLFGGDRLRHCSDFAQMHWPRIFLASNGFARIELNYHKIVAAAYGTFKTVPTPSEINGVLAEYIDSYLLFAYSVDGQIWGQWDTNFKLPKFKTAEDRRSPDPPEPAFSMWLMAYRNKKQTLSCTSEEFQKYSENIPRILLPAVAVADAIADAEKNSCSPASGERVADEPHSDQKAPPARKSRDLTTEQQAGFDAFYSLYPRHKGRKPAEAAWKKIPAELYGTAMAGLRAQLPGLMEKDPEFRRLPATWLNQQGWSDEPDAPRKDRFEKMFPEASKEQA
jgi:hypothetical protein